MLSRSSARVAAVGVVGALLAGCSSAVGEAGPVTIGPTPVTCLGYNGLNRYNPADEVRAGRFRAPGNPATRVAKGADVDWGLDPHHDRTWQLWLHSLEWLGDLIKRFEKTGDRVDLDLVAAITRDWLADNGSTWNMDGRRKEAVEEGTKFRLILMTCLRGHYQAPWLDRAISEHASWLADPDHYSGPWNHGTDESMTLLAAACAINRKDHADIGYRRLQDSVFRPPPGLRPALDTQGANNEQSAHYAVYNRGRWQLAIRTMRVCGRPVPPELLRRHTLLDEFIAYQTTPAGDLVQIGESYAAKAPVLKPPRERSRVYEAGYVMGRSFWGPRTTSDPEGRRAASYIARFGPGHYSHGQNDHMAVTYHAQGRDILVPSGHAGYSDKPWRAWLASPPAHNTLVIDGVRHDYRTFTKLTRHRFTRTGDEMSFSDTAYNGTTRDRSVLVTFGTDALAIYDRARSTTPRTARQLWHLPTTFSAAPTPTGALATAGKTKVHFLSVPLPNAPPPPPAPRHKGGPNAPTPARAQVIKGATNPRQGWIAKAARKWQPAPVVTMTAQGTDARMLTLIIPTTSTTPPTIRTKPSPNGTLTISAKWQKQSLSLTLTPNGALTRLP